MKIIVGLGNIGPKYLETRHNVGFMMLDELAYNRDCSWSENKKLKAKICKPDSDLILAKPQTFMNRSGESVSKIISYFKKAEPKDVIVVHDDVDLEFGEIKLQQGRGSAGHNGVQDIIDKLGTNNFWRFRIGIGRSDNENVSTEDWVLQKFSENELSELKNEIFKSFLEKFDK